MNTIYKAEILNFEAILELPNYWDKQKYKDLLGVMEYGDISEITDADLKDMCYMSIADNEPEEAAKLILGYVFNDRLNSGQIDNLSNEMREEKMWEEYAEIGFHEDFFNTGQILYDAFNGKFPHPEAVKFEVKITSNKLDDLLIDNQISEAALIRLLAQGMPEHTLINRLFTEQLSSGSFVEAENIIWQMNTEIQEDNTALVTVISSKYFFQDLKYVDAFEGKTHNDEEVEEEI
ncbi:hypothetical protein BC962_1284 [Gillisia mitskevichiae]|uniref:Uncharacterized protein n=1 Tax=Gillisia mitskevichiae TaxID=270921 RepID=A0A495PWB8_9FLAO|nr:hypothetical protein [Gillisia mitskevichiae]RKS53039.1 hypothetical protein BC962_1284 [Gillisia mitskevichiae]